MSPTLVLTTVNAPYSKQLDAEELVQFLLNPAAAAEVCPGHISSFFSEVKPHLQVQFAHQFGVTKDQLIASEQAFAKFSGQHYPLAA